MKPTAMLCIFLTGPVLSQALPTFEDTNPDSNYKFTKGEEILSIEETAMSYFDELRSHLEGHLSEDDVFHPVNILRDRDGLRPIEALEIISVAIQNPQAKPVLWIDTSCKAMNKALNSDSLLKVLESGEAYEVTMREAHGKAHLALLSPPTRAKLRKVLIEYRKTIGVGRMDWKKVRKNQPEALEMYRAHACTGVAK